MATAEDLAILLLILVACSLKMSADGTLPTARIRANWEVLYRNGVVSRPWCARRFKALSDFPSRERLLDWQSTYYLPGHLNGGKGQACKWCA